MATGRWLRTKRQTSPAISSAPESRFAFRGSIASSTSRPDLTCESPTLRPPARIYISACPQAQIGFISSKKPAIWLPARGRPSAAMSPAMVASSPSWTPTPQRNPNASIAPSFCSRQNQSKMLVQHSANAQVIAADVRIKEAADGVSVRFLRGSVEAMAVPRHYEVHPENNRLTAHWIARQLRSFGYETE